MSVGILALQGDVAEHRAALADVGVASRPVRRPEDLDGARGLVLPGGESTTLTMLLDSSGLRAPLAARLAEGLPVLGTCAGLILLARRVLDGRPDQWSFGVLDVAVRRNGYGRQQQSFEASLDPARLEAALAAGPGSGEPLPTVFIRAPRVEAVGPGVEVLAEVAAPGSGAGEGDPVLLRQGPVLVSAFHPELTADRRVHRLFAELVTAGSGAHRPRVADAAGTID